MFARAISERCRGRDDALEFLVHGPFAVAGHDLIHKSEAGTAKRVNKAHHLLILELTGDVPRSAAADLNPSLAEERAGRDDEEDVDGGVDGVREGLRERTRGRHVVHQTGHSAKLRGVVHGLQT